MIRKVIFAEVILDQRLDLKEDQSPPEMHLVTVLQKASHTSSKTSLVGTGLSPLAASCCRHQDKQGMWRRESVPCEQHRDEGPATGDLQE